MTVRWKPLLILSGLFLAVALVGVIAITMTLVPRLSQGILTRARAARKAERFEYAENYYKQVLQLDDRNAAVHEELADLYRDWSRSAPPAKKAALRMERLEHMSSAVRLDKAAKRPRHELLSDAMNEDLTADSLRWANEVLKLEPEDPDAHFALAVDALDARTPNVPEARRHLKVLDGKNAPAVRRSWIRMKLADATGDVTARREAFDTAAAISLPADCQPIDRITWLRIVNLQIKNETDTARLPGDTKSMLQQVRLLAQTQELGPARVARLRSIVEQTQRDLIERSAKVDATARAEFDRLVESIEVDLEAIFKLALSGEQEPDSQTFLTYAEHLMFRRQRDRCLAVIDQALKSPQATRRNSIHSVMGLHMVAVEMALSSRTTRGGSTRPALTCRPCSPARNRDSRRWATSLPGRSSSTSRAWRGACRGKMHRPPALRNRCRSCAPARFTI